MKMAAYKLLDHIHKWLWNENKKRETEQLNKTLRKGKGMTKTDERENIPMKNEAKREQCEAVINWVLYLSGWPHSQANAMTAVLELFCSLSLSLSVSMAPGKLKMAAVSPEEVLAVCRSRRMIWDEAERETEQVPCLSLLVSLTQACLQVLACPCCFSSGGTTDRELSILQDFGKEQAVPVHCSFPSPVFIRGRKDTISKCQEMKWYWKSGPVFCPALANTRLYKNVRKPVKLTGMSLNSCGVARSKNFFSKLLLQSMAFPWNVCLSHALQAMVRVWWNIYRSFLGVQEHNIPFRIFQQHMISKGHANTKHLHLILWLKPPHNCTTGRRQRKLGQEWKQSHINHTMTSADWLVAHISFRHCIE